MTVAVTGISHHTSSLDLRERLAFAEGSIPAALHKLKKRLSDGGVVILSTCNRVEIYTRSDDAPPVVFETVRRFLEEWHGVPEAEFADALYEYADREAVAHVFRVASSLDSLVIGEQQILGQVHDAYLLAHSEAATEKIISALFQRAFKVAKEVRTKSTISQGKVSVASVAVDLAVSIFSDLADKTVMIIGSGETGELALRSLISQGVKQVLLVNRTVEKAQELAAKYHGRAYALDNLHEILPQADIIITSTASPEPILRREDFHRALKHRNQSPMFIIDIAVPRDVDREANQLDNIYLYDIDDLQEVADSNLQARRAEIAQCMEIVDKQVSRFMQWRQQLYAEPTIVSMSQEWHQIRERELQKTLHTLNDLTEKQREEVEYLTKRIVNNILQRPMSQIKQEVVREDPHRVIHLVKRLFGLEESAG
ncbi:MAG: glutamyl-tRNA reductase [Candidatus Hydrogenedentes bacterium]|nr:glutamyl-tRNA reductase [Candidatus Hydrogenedentota bacterium]